MNMPEVVDVIEMKKIDELPEYLRLADGEFQIKKIKQHFNLNGEFQSYFYKPLDSTDSTPEIWGILGTIPEPNKIAYRLV